MERAMSATLTREASEKRTNYVGNDRLLSGMILGVLAFWLFALMVVAAIVSILRTVPKASPRERRMP
jgi:hypothetical protein